MADHRVAQIVGFEAAQPGPLGVLPKVRVEGLMGDVEYAVLGSQALQGASVGLQGVKGKTKKDLFWDKFFQGFQSAVAAVSDLRGQVTPR